MLTAFNQQLLKKESLNDALESISEWSKKLIHAERCSLFVYDKKENRLRSLWADGPVEIEIPFDQGVIGETLRTNKAVLENEPYDDFDFFADIDMQTGYYTQNILSAPLVDKNEQLFGVIELLNKKGGFQKEDLQLLTQIAAVIGRNFTYPHTKG